MTHPPWNDELELTEAIGKQHEAMSRAIMLAGNRKSQNPAAPLPKSSGVQLLEKKVISLESELKALKQMLASTQKERDSFLKEINQLHSQGIAHTCFNTICYTKELFEILWYCNELL